MRIRVNWQGGPTTYTVVDHHGLPLRQCGTMAMAEKYCAEHRERQARRQRPKKDKK